MIGRSLLVCILLAGCTQTDAGTPSQTRDAFHKLDCDPTTATSINAAAPVANGLRGGAIDAARALARAMGDSLVSDKPIEESDAFGRWSTKRGEVQASRDSGEGLWMVEYSAPASDAFSAAKAAEVARSLGASAVDAGRDNTASHGTFRQALGGGWIAYIHGEGYQRGTWGSMGAWALRDLSATPRPTENAQAIETAIAFDRCTMDRDGFTVAAGYASTGQATASLSAHGDALVWRVDLAYTEPTPSHCGMRRIVAVDALTGAVVAQVPFMCD